LLKNLSLRAPPSGEIGAICPSFVALTAFYQSFIIRPQHFAGGLSAVP
jgi:hypothetical protein